MPRELEAIFAELGLAQYLHAFVDQGFDSWDTILDIQESDLETLRVKLGHRRKLQRCISNARGIIPRVSTVSALELGSDDSKRHIRNENAKRSEAGSESTNGIAKRKYRRHCKRDENAPKRPLSAYVLFSNKMRKELKSHNFSFIEIAKLVGEYWQNLHHPERECYENQANAGKDKYRWNLAQYKRTPEYRRYAQYLQKFKEKQEKLNQGSKVHVCTNDTLADGEFPSMTNRSSGRETSKRQRVDAKPGTARLRLDSIQGRTTRCVTPTGQPSSVASRTVSGRGGERLRESEPPAYRRRRIDHIASIAESQMSSTPPTILSNGNSVGESGVLPRIFDFSSANHIDSLHLRHSAMLYNRPEQVKQQPQQLPSLSDLPGEDSRRGLGGRLTAAGLPPMGMGPPLTYQGGNVVKHARGSKLPASRPTGDSAPAIHALPFDQKASNPLYAKAPKRGANILISSDNVDPPHGAPSSEFFSNSLIFRQMDTEQAEHGDFATERSPPSTEKGRFDGMSALLQASEIVRHHRTRREEPSTRRQFPTPWPPSPTR